MKFESKQMKIFKSDKRSYFLIKNLKNDLKRKPNFEVALKSKNKSNASKKDTVFRICR